MYMYIVCSTRNTTIHDNIPECCCHSTKSKAINIAECTHTCALTNLNFNPACMNISCVG